MPDAPPAALARRPNSVAATQRETFPWSSNLNPAARDAITQRVNEAAADLKPAATAFRAERARTRPWVTGEKSLDSSSWAGLSSAVVTAACRPRSLGDDPINCRPSDAHCSGQPLGRRASRRAGDNFSFLFGGESRLASG